MTKLIKQEVDQAIWWKIHDVLLDARDNSLELMNINSENESHLPVKKFNAIQSMYEKEIREINALLDYSVDHGGKPS